MKKQIIHLPVIVLVIIVNNMQVMAQNFKAAQYVQSASIELNGSIDRVFPLFTALGEKKWAEDWNPNALFPSSGEMQEGLIFQTPDHVPGAPQLTWVVSRYDVSGHQIQYIVTSAIRVTVISVSCASSGKNGTAARVSYTLTGLNPEGNELSRHLIGKIFERNLKDWETAINAYLK